MKRRSLTQRALGDDKEEVIDDPTAGRRRCAVIANPTKTSDSFHALVHETLQRDGWVDTLWLETTVEDAGRAVTRQAVSEGVDLVLCAGGDGTVRVVADGLAGTAIPMGLVPVGTGNLLARNLDLPLDEAGAIDVAFSGRTRCIDLVEVRADNGEPQHFAVMAGLGVDAMTMEETDTDLKDKIGSAAYFVAAAKALGRLPLKLTVRLDDRRRLRRRAMVCLIGNVGELRGNLVLIPGAQPDDGLLDLFIASPHSVWHWLKLTLRLVTRRPTKDDQVDQRRGKSVTVRIGHPESYQLDGDVIGECTTLTAVVKPGALTICIPTSELASSTP